MMADLFSRLFLWTAISSVLLCGCRTSPEQSPSSQILPTQTPDPVVISPTPITVSQNTPEEVAAALVNSQNAIPLNENYPNPELQQITVQNIQQIVPIAQFDGFGFVRAISADGKQYAMALAKGIRIYDSVTSQPVAFYPVDGYNVVQAVFSGDGSKLAVVYSRYHSPDVIEIRSDKSGSVSLPARYEVKVWDLVNKKPLFNKNLEDFCGLKIFIGLFQFLEDGSLVVASQDFDTHFQSVCRISGQNGTLLDRLDLDPGYGYIRSLALTADGSTLAAAFSSGDRDFMNPLLVTFRYPDGEALFEKSLASMPNALVFVGVEPTLVYNSQPADGQSTIEVIHPAGDRIRSIPVEDANGYNFVANDHSVIVPQKTQVTVYDLASGNEIQRIPWAAQSETLFTAVAQAQLVNQPVNLFGESDDNIFVLLASDSDELIVYQHCQQVSCSSMIRSIDLNHPEQDQSRLEATFRLSNRGADLSPDGQKIAMGGLWNGDVRVWSTASGELFLQLQGHQEMVYQTVFSPDSSMLATASEDGTVWLWNANNGEPLHTLSGHNGAVLQAAFSPDGLHLATAGADNTLRLWQVSSGKEVKQFPQPKPEYYIENLWYLDQQTLLLDLADWREKCMGCYSSAFLLDTESGAATELPWQHLQANQSPAGEWLFRFGSYPDFVLGFGKIIQGQIKLEKQIGLSSINNSQEIALSSDGQLVYSLNENGLNVIDRSSGEQIALAANYLGVLTSGNGRLETSTDGRFLLDFTEGTVMLWGVPEE